MKLLVICLSVPIASLVLDSFRTEVLREIAPYLRTRAEEVELSLLAARHGPVAFAPAAIAYDPKPPNTAQVATQRARRLQSQWGVWRYHWRDILHLLLRGDVGSKALAFSLLFKPKALIFSLKILFLALFLAIPAAPIWFRTTVIISLVSAFLCRGVTPRDGNRYPFQRALAQSPGLNSHEYPVPLSRSVALC